MSGHASECGHASIDKIADKLNISDLFISK